MGEGSEVLHFLPLDCSDEITHQHHVPKAGSIQVTTQNVAKYLDGLEWTYKQLQKIRIKSGAKQYSVYGIHMDF